MGNSIPYGRIFEGSASNWICKNKAPESINFFMQFGLKKKKKKKKKELM